MVEEEYIYGETLEDYEELVYIGDGVIAVPGYAFTTGKRKGRFRDHILVKEHDARSLKNTQKFVSYIPEDSVEEETDEK